MGVMDIFYNKKVSIYQQAQSEPNELGVVENVLIHIVDSKAVSNPLTIRQASERYGLNTAMSIEYTIEYFEEVYELVMSGAVLFIVDGSQMFKVQQVNVYEQFYVLDSCMSVAVERSDV